jgi:predicted aspartyl protease
LAWCIAAAGAAQAACQVTTFLTLPVTVVRSKPLAPAKLNGADVTVILDTGAFFSGMTAEGASKLGLPLKPVPSNWHIGAGDWHVGTVASLSLGPATFRNADFLVGGRIAQVGAAARIGANSLTASTVEFDFGQGVMRFVKLEGCAGDQAAYWAKGAGVSTVALETATPMRPQPRGQIRVNDVPVQVMFDTGSPTTSISRAAAARAHIDLGAPDVRAAPAISRAVGGDLVPALTARAGSLRIGNEEMKDRTVEVADLGVADHDGLVGMDFFMTHRVLIDREHARLYFTANAPGSSP